MRTERLTWEEFTVLYKEAIQRYCEERVVAEAASLQFVKDADSKHLPPMELEYMKKYARSDSRSDSRRSGGDVNKMSTYQEPDLEHEEPQRGEPPDEDEGYETSPESEQPPPGDAEELPGGHAKDEHSAESKEEHPQHDMMNYIPKDEQEDEQRLLAMASSDKSKLVCFNFANKGVCNYEKENGKKCRYSHDAEDMKIYLALKQLGGVRGVRDVVNRSYANQKTNPTGGTAGLAGRSPGIRPPLPGSKPTGFGKPSGYSGGPPKWS